MPTTYKKNTKTLDENQKEGVMKLHKYQGIKRKSKVQDETEYLLSDDANRQHLMRSIAEFERKEIVKFTMEEFFKKYQS